MSPPRFVLFYVLMYTAPTAIYSLSLHDALPISAPPRGRQRAAAARGGLGDAHEQRVPGGRGAVARIRGGRHRRARAASHAPGAGHRTLAAVRFRAAAIRELTCSAPSAARGTEDRRQPA